MALDGIGMTLSTHSIAGVRAANEQVRTLGAGVSQLLQGVAQVAESAGTAASGGTAPSSDASRGQNLDILV